MNHPETLARLRAMGILGARLPPVAVSARYRTALALGAALVGLFPFLYAALIPLAAWAAWSLAVAHPSAPASIGFLLGGCLLTLSLLKPLVARPGRGAEPRFLDPAEQPLLFAFVRELASIAGAPEPRRIAVDCGVNCCCVLRGGIAGSSSRSDFVLAIGLPLVVGLRLDQLAGVLAHELGHAAQTSASRSSYLLWTVNAWFSRVVFEPDQFDERFLQPLETAGAGKKLALRFVRVLVQPGRGALWLLRLAEGVVSSVFLRRMELDADRLQVRVAGSGAFVSTVSEANLLGIAAQRAVVELGRMWRQGRLADNYPGLVVSLRGRYSEEFARRLQTGLEEGGAGLFRAHPCDKDRIALARAENSPGILKGCFPAAALFVGCEQLCREATLTFYAQEFDLTPEGIELVPLQEILTEGGSAL